MTAFFSIKKNIDSLIAAFIAFGFILLLTHHGGVGISPDSIMYASTARNIAAGKGFLQFENLPLVIFPVGYPSFLSSIMWLSGKDIIAIAPYINAGLLAAVIYLCGCMMNEFVNASIIYKRVILFFLIFSPCLLDVFSMLWSETLFIFLLLLFIIALHFYLGRKTFGSLLLLTAITALACVTRYAGITIAATGGLFLLLQRNISWKKKTWHLLFFCLLGSSLVAVNLLHNNAVSGTFTGIRQAGKTALLENIKYFGFILCDWLPVIKKNTGFSIFIAISFFITISISIKYRYFSNKNFNSFENIAAVFFIIYSFFIVASATVSRYETLNNRFFSPLFICWLWSFTYFIPQWLITIAKKWKLILVITLVSIAGIAFQANQYSRSKDLYNEYHDEGIGGYAEDLWQQSPTMRFLKTHPTYFAKDVAIYCNANEAVYYFTGMVVQSLPEQVHKKFVQNFYEQKKQYVIWLTETGNPDLLNMNEIGKYKTLTVLQKFSDGVIYFCENK